ncbi:MAG: mechanosensitive ion channel domain-containing protein [Oscillospiraceae bacterium]
MILSSHPFALGDFIEAGGTSGTVREIGLNHTKLETANGQMILMPNKDLSSSRSSIIPFWADAGSSGPSLPPMTHLRKPS